MNIVIETLTLRNASLPDTTALEFRAVADPACTYLCIPESVRAQLGLAIIELKPAFFADETRALVPYVGPIELRFKDRIGFCGALVMGDEVLLGALPMEDMNLIINRRTLTLEFSPTGAHL